jgi:hypothetical protein
MEGIQMRTMNAVGNQFGFTCPDCAKGDELTITAQMIVQARLTPDGTDDDGGDTEWDDASEVRCGCGWNGTVAQLKVEEVEDSMDFDSGTPDVYAS